MFYLKAQWFPYDCGSQIAIRSAIVCDHMETTSAIVCDPAIVIAEDRTMFYLLRSSAINCDCLRSAICDPRSYGNQPLDRTWFYLLRSSAITIAGSQTIDDMIADRRSQTIAIDRRQSQEIEHGSIFFDRLRSRSQDRRRSQK